MLIQSIVRQEKETLTKFRQVCVGHLLLGTGLPSSVVCVPSETPVEETEFSLVSGYQWRQLLS